MKILLTDEQQAIVNHPLPGHGRVLAGPGTGKSATAVALAEGILTTGQNQSKVKFLTFTRATTQELGKKLSSSQLNIIDKPSTIHSFSISTLLRNPGCASFPEPLRIPDDFEYKILIRPHLGKQTQVGVRKLDGLIAEMAAKWESLNPEERPGITSEERARFMGAWLLHRRIFGYTLIQELPDLFRCALRDHGDLNGIDYHLLTIDEYQDLNACDLEVIRRLAERGSSILAIGDDDQSIYSFRKAHPEGIRRFLTDYQTDRDYKLTICQRSARKIVEWTQYIIQGDVTRVARNLLRCRSDMPDGVTALLSFRGDRSEAKGVADLVCLLRDVQGVPASEILILTRTDRFGTFSKPIKQELIKRNVPISDPSVIEDSLREEQNRYLLDILRLLVNGTDSLAWWSLLCLQDKIGAKFIDYIYGRAISMRVTFGEAFISAAGENFTGGPLHSRRKAHDLWHTISSTLKTVQLPTETAKWGQWIVDEMKNGHLPACSHNLEDLMIRIDDIADVDGGLGRFLSQIQPLGEDLSRAQNDGVRFMTMTGSKGLTVRATILVGVDNDLIPRPDQDLAEERRLLYVAMTRSQECLFLTWSSSRRGPGARSGTANMGRRQPCDFLRGGPIESQDGFAFIKTLKQSWNKEE
jgi:DNA helicase-2/ATP-dependent DNA helicase PcrA